MSKKILLFIVAVFLLSGCGNVSKIDQVKEKFLNGCSNHPVGELLENAYDDVSWEEKEDKITAIGLSYDFDVVHQTIYEFTLKNKNLIVNRVAKKLGDDERIYDKDDFDDLVNNICNVSDIASKGSLKTKAKVKLLYNEEAFIVEGAPEEVEITIYGSDADIYDVDKNNDYEVFLYLRNLDPSDRKQKVCFQTSYDSKKVLIKPSEEFAEITISNKVADAFELDYEIINQDKLKNKIIAKVSLGHAQIVCRGSKKTLDEVAEVKAIFDLSDSNSLDEGIVTLESSNIQAFDKKGKVLENIEIVPSSVNASIEIDNK